MKLDKYDIILESDLAKFPDFDKYLKNLNILKDYDFKGATPWEISEKFFDYATIFLQADFVQKPERFNQHKLYRVRLNIDTKSEDINLIQTHSYPLPCFCSSNGRANIKGKSVFYCSTKPEVALYESRPKKGAEGFLSIWKPKAERPIKFGLLISTDLRADNPWHVLAKTTFETINEFLKTHAKYKYEHFVELFSFIAERFKNEKKPYPITSYLSHELIYGKKWHDLILYPSVATDNKFCNMAIHPNTVNNQLRLEKVIRFKIREIDGERILYSITSVGEVIDTNIKWRLSRPEEKDFMNLE
jgi:hypothetical protein